MTNLILEKLAQTGWFQNARAWVRKVVAAFVSGGSAALYSSIGITAGHTVTSSVPELTWQTAVAIFVTRGVVKVLEVLKKEPIPGVIVEE